MKLQTERTIIRSFSPKDLSEYYKILSNEAVYSWLGNRTKRTEEQAAKALDYFSSELEKNGYGVYAIMDKETNQLIGQAGFNYIKELERTEYLYALDPAFWGKGVATEVGQFLISDFKKRFHKQELIALAYEGNDRSSNVLRKLGFQAKGRKEIFGSELEYFVME